MTASQYFERRPTAASVNFLASLTPQKFGKLGKFGKFNSLPITHQAIGRQPAERSSDFRRPTPDPLDAVAFRCTLATVRSITLDASLAASVVVPERRDPPN
jgi:hypothetical protein